MPSRFFQKLGVMALAFVLSGPARLSLAQDSNGKLEIFVDGKKYDSEQEYKQYRLKKMQEETMEDKTSEANTASKISGFFYDLKDELKQEGGTSLNQKVTDHKAEIQALLNQLAERSGEKELLIFDPDKMKTIYLVPQESGIGESEPQAQSIPVDALQNDLKDEDSP